MNHTHANPVEIIGRDIYVIKNDINDKVYVGQSQDVERRFAEHCKNLEKVSSLVNQAIQEYGKEHFWYEILESNIQNYNEQEQYWIRRLNSKSPNGYNIADGGLNPPVKYGEDSHLCHIKQSDIDRIKDDLKHTRMSFNEISRKYGISKHHVCRINQGVSRRDDGETYPLREVKNINGKLSEDDVAEIIHLLKYSYLMNGEIARRFQVDVHAIVKINNGEQHKVAGEHYPIRTWKSCGKHHLTYDQVSEIMDLLALTEDSMRKIAKRFDIPHNLIILINSGKSKMYHRNNVQYPIRKPNDSVTTIPAKGSRDAIDTHPSKEKHHSKGCGKR